MVVYIFSIAVFAIDLVLQKLVIEKKYIQYDSKTSDQIGLLILLCNILVTYTIPIGSFFYFWIMIKVRNYMPSVSGREKELVSVLYFQIIIVGGFVVSHYDAFFVVLIVGAPYYRRYFFSALLFVFASFGYRE